MTRVLLAAFSLLLVTACDSGTDSQEAQNDSRASKLVLQAMEEGKPSLVLVRRGQDALAKAFPAFAGEFKESALSVAIDGSDSAETSFMTAYGEAISSKSVLLVISPKGDVMKRYEKDPGKDELSEVLASRLLPRLVAALEKPGMALLLYGGKDSEAYKKADKTVRKIFPSRGNGPVVLRVDVSDEREKIFSRMLKADVDKEKVAAFAFISGKPPVRVRDEMTPLAFTAPFASCSVKCGPSG